MEYFTKLDGRGDKCHHIKFIDAEGLTIICGTSIEQPFEVVAFMALEHGANLNEVLALKTKVTSGAVLGE